MGVRREVAHTVARLAADGSCREKIFQYGMIPVLVTMSSAPDVDTTTGRCVCFAAAIFCTAFRSPDACRSVNALEQDFLVRSCIQSNYEK